MEFIKVIIVGGGVAGLAAAKTLGPNVNYLLIEAQDYLGGRIHTVDAGCSSFFCSYYKNNLYTFLLMIHNQFQMSLLIW
jgi:protoporphyrinogen oxidase